jgi:hypothetical protein
MTSKEREHFNDSMRAIDRGEQLPPPLAEKKCGGYEAHLTFDQKHEQEVRAASKATSWKFSVITGCPVLGQGTYCYLSGYNPDSPHFLLGQMGMVILSLEKFGIVPLRSKIEHIVYDTKTGVNEL